MLYNREKDNWKENINTSKLYGKTNYIKIIATIINQKKLNI